MRAGNNAGLPAEPGNVLLGWFHPFCDGFPLSRGFSPFPPPSPRSCSRPGWSIACSTAAGPAAAPAAVAWLALPCCQPRSASGSSGCDLCVCVCTKWLPLPASCVGDRNAEAMAPAGDSAQEGNSANPLHLAIFPHLIRQGANAAVSPRAVQVSSRLGAASRLSPRGPAVLRWARSWGLAPFPCSGEFTCIIQCCPAG